MSGAMQQSSAVCTTRQGGSLSEQMRRMGTPGDVPKLQKISEAMQQPGLSGRCYSESGITESDAEVNLAYEPMKVSLPARILARDVAGAAVCRTGELDTAGITSATRSSTDYESSSDADADQAQRAMKVKTVSSATNSPVGGSSPVAALKKVELQDQPKKVGRGSTSAETTAMLTELPGALTEEQLCEELWHGGFRQGVDFNALYLPKMVDANVNCGVCVINFTSVQTLQSFIAAFDGRVLNGFGVAVKVLSHLHRDKHMQREEVRKPVQPSVAHPPGLEQPQQAQAAPQAQQNLQAQQRARTYSQERQACPPTQTLTSRFGQSAVLTCPQTQTLTPTAAPPIVCRCSSCSAPTPSKANFCTNCGAKLVKSAQMGFVNNPLAGA